LACTIKRLSHQSKPLCTTRHTASNLPYKAAHSFKAPATSKEGIVRGLT
jgi:hypothetical protein